MPESKVIAVAGYGPGISRAVARRFGKERFSVALLARNKEKLNDAVTGAEDLTSASRKMQCGF